MERKYSSIKWDNSFGQKPLIEFPDAALVSGTVLIAAFKLAENMHMFETFIEGGVHRSIPEESGQGVAW